MRGLSQARLGSVNARLFGILGALLPPPVQAQSAGDRQGTFFVQKDAKSFAQVCERVLAEIEEIHGELLTEQIGKAHFLYKRTPRVLLKCARGCLLILRRSMAS